MIFFLIFIENFRNVFNNDYISAYYFILHATAGQSNPLSTFPHNTIKTTRLQSRLLQDKKLNLSTIITNRPYDQAAD